MEQRVTFVTKGHEDRQWDCRFNIPNEQYLDEVLASIKSENDKGKFKYILVGGIEIGTRPNQNDYKCKHIHVAVIFHNRASKASILRNWSIIEGHGYYLVPRNRDLPYSGWKNHHIKLFSKINPDSVLLFEQGELPVDKNVKRIEANEVEKKRKLDDILRDMREMYESGRGEECFDKFPRTTVLYGERIKAMISQKKDFFQTKRHPNIWLHGYPGSGKTTLLNFIYPNYFKKNLHNKFFDLYDPKIHTHIMLEDLDHEAVERLSINFIKTTCDEAGFAVDQKYKTPQLTQAPVLVTSNFTIPQIIPDGKGIEENKAALMRRFYHIRIDMLLQFLCLRLLPKEERVKLQKEGNNDPGKLFLTWDYLQDRPLCMPLRDPEHYQEIIRDTYYK